MTTQDLYTKLSKGEITEQKFLYEVRRDVNLPWITSSNSFKDTITILKNKGMISEKQTKESTGKQEVEIIAKTIDMVNPYEYSKGMDFELDLVYDAVGNADLTEDEILKAQKKVLKNLTNNPSYYTQKMSTQMEGESEYEIELNDKSIADLIKKNKGKKGKIIREHGEDAERVADVNADSTMLELAGTEAVDPLLAIIGAGGLATGAVALSKLMDALEDGKLGPKGEAVAKFLRSAGKTFSGQGAPMREHGEEFDRVADVNADSSPLEEEEVEELGRKRDAIYEKYAQKYGVDVNELKDKVEARKLETEDVNIKATDPKASETAAAITKANPDAKVNIVKERRRGPFAFGATFVKSEKGLEQLQKAKDVFAKLGIEIQRDGPKSILVKDLDDEEIIKTLEDNGLDAANGRNWGVYGKNSYSR